MEFRFSFVFAKPVEEVHDAAHCLCVRRVAVTDGQDAGYRRTVEDESFRCLIRVVAEVLRYEPSALLVGAQMLGGDVFGQVRELFERRGSIIGISVTGCIRFYSGIDSTVGCFEVVDARKQILASVGSRVEAPEADAEADNADKTIQIPILEADSA